MIIENPKSRYTKRVVIRPLPPKPATLEESFVDSFLNPDFKMQHLMCTKLMISCFGINPWKNTTTKLHDDDEDESESRPITISSYTNDDSPSTKKRTIDNAEHAPSTEPSASSSATNENVSNTDLASPPSTIPGLAINKSKKQKPDTHKYKSSKRRSSPNDSDDSIASDNRESDIDD